MCFCLICHGLCPASRRARSQKRYFSFPRFPPRSFLYGGPQAAGRWRGPGHGLKPGEPGQFHVAPGASYSAWCHEYKHFCDDRANGYLGTEKASKNRSMRMRMEFDAYQLEIDMAKEANRLDIVERLEKLRDKEILRISAKGGPVW